MAYGKPKGKAPVMYGGKKKNSGSSFMMKMKKKAMKKAK